MVLAQRALAWECGAEKVMSTYDWQKHAASVIEDKEIERTFMEQAYTHVANKAPALMEAPYSIGFEIIQKNELNNRLVGAFGFRAGDDLLLAPVLFLNGVIKGAELLWRRSAKAFVPFTEGWAKYLIEKRAPDEGRGISRKETSNTRETVRLDRIISPGGIKSASFEELKEMLKVGSADLDEYRMAVAEMVEHVRSMSKAASPANFLSDFLVDFGDTRAVGAIGDLVKASHAFAEALVTVHPDPADYMPPALLQKVKAANAVTSRDLLVLHTGRPGPETPAEVTEGLCKRGWNLVDERDNNLTAMEILAEEEFNAIDIAGEYDVLLVGGKTVKAFGAPLSNKRFCDIGGLNGNFCEPCCISSGGSLARGTAAVTSDGTLIWRSDGKIHGDPVNEEWPASDPPKRGKDTMRSGKTYLVYDTAAQTFFGPVRVLSRETGKDKSTVYRLSSQDPGWAHYEDDTPAPNSGVLVVHNKSGRGTNPDGGVIGPDAVFFELKVTEEKRPEQNDTKYTIETMPAGAPADVRDWMESAGFRKVNLLKKGSEYLLHFGPRRNTCWMNAVQTAVKMASDLGIPAGEVTVVMDILEKKPGESSTGLWVRPHEKNAAAIRLIESPDFRQYRDDRFGVPEEHPQSFALQTESDKPHDPGQNIGDAWDPAYGGEGNVDKEMPDDVLFGGQPEQIAQMAEQKGMPNVFDHGLVGMLVRTYDAVSMIDRYMPKWEEGLDCLGRALFLLYWKPDDFEQAFGVDDMQEMENKVSSCFQLLGEIVLDLKLKWRDRDRRTGSVPTNS
jgi:hypothetical protein